MLPQPGTRTNVKTAIDARFSSLGYRGATAGFTVERPEWFHSAPTDAAGALVTPLLWSWAEPYARFYAVFPEATTANSIALSPATHSGTPYVDFEVKPSIADQVDLMVASSGEVKYETRGTAPKARLEFYHALTAVKIAVGQNLSWNKRITKVEIKNACSKGKYMLPTQYGGAGTWVAGSLTDRKDFVLDVAASPIDLKQKPNTVIMGNPADNYTFYMIPQELDNKVTAEITFTDNTTISVPLKGSWKEGTTRTYKLSHKNSSWVYSITSDSPSAVAYNATSTGNYGITSFRQAPDGTKKPVAWKVIGYSEDNGNTWTTTKPAWLKSREMVVQLQNKAQLH